MKRFICMKCGKIYYENSVLPTIDNEKEKGDGCCFVGSLIEIKQENDNIGNWLVLGDHVFDKSKGRSGELKPSIE